MQRPAVGAPLARPSDHSHLPARDTASAIAAMTAMPLPELRALWHAYHPGLSMPDGLPRDLLVRSIAWKLEAKEHGDMPKALKRRLDALSAQLDKSGDLDLERSVSLKCGTHIVREWRGATHRVIVAEEGYIFEDRRYASLSHVARVITGTRWSGPRFFGLKQRKLQKVVTHA